MTTTLTRPPAVRVPDATMDRRTAAVVAGVGYALIFGLAIIANFFVLEGLVVSDDPATTAANVRDSMSLFRFGFASFLAIFLIEVIVTWALYIVFRSENHDLSLLAAWLRLAFTVVFGAALAYFFQALAFYDAPSLVDALGAAEGNALALASLESFRSAWVISLAAFGLHLVVLGYLVARSTEAPRLLGLFMIVAGSAYVIDTAAHVLLSNYQDYETPFLMMVAIPSIGAECWFGLWLLLRAGKSAPDHMLPA